VKLKPTNNEQLAAQLSRLQFVDVSPAHYFSIAAVNKMCGLQMHVSAFEDESSQADATAARQAGVGTAN
jgi:hypothetical protein